MILPTGLLNRCKDCEYNDSVTTQGDYYLFMCRFPKLWTDKMSDCPLKYIELTEHCIGLDNKKPYTRHEKQFYKPYRNYFCTTPNDELWNELENQGYAKHAEYDMSATFHLTRKGLDWLGNIIDCEIYDCG